MNGFFIGKTEPQNVQYLQFYLVLVEEDASVKSFLKLIFLHLIVLLSKEADNLLRSVMINRKDEIDCLKNQDV